MKNDMIFSTMHKISYYKVRVSTGSVETRWVGGSFFNVLQKQRWQAGFWLHRCVLRNSLAGSKKRVLCAGTTLYPALLHTGSTHAELPCEPQEITCVKIHGQTHLLICTLIL